MDSRTAIFQDLLNSFMSAVPSHPEEYAFGHRELIFPIASYDTVMNLCSEAEKIFSSEPIVLAVSSPVIIVGDLHGHILDLYRILLKYGLPDKRQYLFLGDLVDRGEFSVETIIIVFLLKILYPKQVHIIRGNHEFQYLCEQSGFLSQLLTVYNDRILFDRFLQTFSQMPLVAMVDHTMLCVHGGLGPSWYSLGQVQIMKRPIKEFDDDLLNAMLWSDPSLDTENFIPSNRGVGYQFGKTAVYDFVRALGIKVIVRAHECVSSGYQELFDGKLITLFSASNYCGVIGNESAVLQVTSAFRYEPVKFCSLQYLRRNQAIFRAERNETVVTARDAPKPRRKQIQAANSNIFIRLSKMPNNNKNAFDESPRKSPAKPKVYRPTTGLKYQKTVSCH